MRHHQMPSAGAVSAGRAAATWAAPPPLRPTHNAVAVLSFRGGQSAAAPAPSPVPRAALTQYAVGAPARGRGAAVRAARRGGCAASALRRGGGGGGGGGGGAAAEEDDVDERGWWEKPEEVDMSAYAVEPLEQYQEEALEAAYAQFGRRKMKVQQLAGQLGLDRGRVIAWIKEFQLKDSRVRDALLARRRAESEAERIRTERQAVAEAAVKLQPHPDDMPGGFIPYYTRKEMGIATRKRLPADVQRTLESIYSRSPFPSNDVIRGVWELHRIHRDVVLEWLQRRRAADGIECSSQRRRERVRGGSAAIPSFGDEDEEGGGALVTGDGPSTSSHGADLLTGLMSAGGGKAGGGADADGGGTPQSPSRIVEVSRAEMALIRSALPSRRKHKGKKMEERLGIRSGPDEEHQDALQVGQVKYVEDKSGKQAAKWRGSWRFQGATAGGPVAAPGATPRRQRRARDGGSQSDEDASEGGSGDAPAPSAP